MLAKKNKKKKKTSMKFFTKMYDKTIDKAKKNPKASTWSLSLFSMGESVIIPLPVDPFLIFLGLAQQKKALKLAVITALSSSLGGVIGYILGFFFWSQIQGYVPHYIHSHLNEAFVYFREYEALAIFIAGFTFIPYKVFTLGAGIAHISFFNFVLFSLLSRGLRFLLIGGLIYFKGPAIEPFLRKYLGHMIVLVTLIFIFLYFLL